VRYVGKDWNMQHVDQKDLAKRWLISPRTLEQWRWQGKGPRYVKVGARVIYPLPEVEAYEAARLHANTVAPVGDQAENASEEA
jgi:hypothetical protein